jgi:hypothetical protein
MQRNISAACSETGDTNDTSGIGVHIIFCACDDGVGPKANNTSDTSGIGVIIRDTSFGVHTIFCACDACSETGDTNDTSGIGVHIIFCACDAGGGSEINNTSDTSNIVVIIRDTSFGVHTIFTACDDSVGTKANSASNNIRARDQSRQGRARGGTIGANVLGARRRRASPGFVGAIGVSAEMRSRGRDF